MKNLKYFKIFEAFESSKISKTLKFINKSSRETFIQKLKGVAPKQTQGGFVDRTVFLYTHVKWDYKKDRCNWYQEAYNKQIGKSGSVPIEKSPWIPLRMLVFTNKIYLL